MKSQTELLGPLTDNGPRVLTSMELWSPLLVLPSVATGIITSAITPTSATSVAARVRPRLEICLFIPAPFVPLRNRDPPCGIPQSTPDLNPPGGAVRRLFYIA